MGLVTTLLAGKALFDALTDVYKSAEKAVDALEKVPEVGNRFIRAVRRLRGNAESPKETAKAIADEATYAAKQLKKEGEYRPRRRVRVGPPGKGKWKWED